MSRDKGRTHVAAVDVGASGGRVMLATFDGETIELVEAHRFDTPLGIDPATGHDCWDSEAIVRDRFQAIIRATPVIR